MTHILADHFAVLPLLGKDPVGCLVPHGVYDAAEIGDHMQVGCWWSDGDHNIGIACGASGLAIVDVDPRNGGAPAMAALVAELGPLPETFTVSTGRGDGGYHLYFRQPSGEGIGCGHLGVGIDIKGYGGYVVGPWSTHPDTGGTYVISCDAPPAELPAAWLMLIRARIGAAREERAKHKLTADWGWPRSIGRPSDTPLDPEAELLACSAELRTAPLDPAKRHHVALRVSARVGKLVAAGQITYERARSTLTEAAAALDGNTHRHAIEDGLAACLADFEDDADAKKDLLACAAELRDAPLGTRHDTAFRVAARVGRLVGAGRVPEDQARSVLMEAAAAVSGNTHERTIDDGLADGSAEPEFGRRASEAAWKRLFARVNPAEKAREEERRAKEDLAAERARAKASEGQEAAARKVAEAEERRDAAKAARLAAEREERNREKARTSPDTETATKLSRSESGAPTGSATNVLQILLHDPLWKGRLWRNEYIGEGGEMIDDRAFGNHDDDLLVIRCDAYGFAPDREKRWVAIRQVCCERRVDPVLDSLERLGAAMPVDGAISQLAKVLGIAADDLLGRRYLRCWLISAVARARRPGVQADHILVLRGGGGHGKTRAMRLLVAAVAHGKYFCEAGIPKDPRDALSIISRAWIHVMGELASLSGRDTESVKDWITQIEDMAVPKYQTVPIRRLRRCVFAATMNADSALPALTDGAARRWWVINVGEIEHERIPMLAPLAWGEAVRAFDAGEPWHLTGETERQSIARAEEHDRIAMHPWFDRVQKWIFNGAFGSVKEGGRLYVVQTDVLDFAGVECGDKVSAQDLRAILTRLGCECGLPQRTIGGRRARWIRLPSGTNEGVQQTSTANAENR